MGPQIMSIKIALKEEMHRGHSQALVLVEMAGLTQGYPKHQKQVEE